MKRALPSVLGVLALGFSAGYWWEGRSPSTSVANSGADSSMTEEAVRKGAAAATAVSQIKSRSADRAPAAIAPVAIPSGSPTALDAAMAAELKRAGLEEKYRALLQVFGDTPVGRTLAAAGTWRGHGEMTGSEGAKYLEQSMQALREDSEAALQQFQDALPKMTDSMADSRRFLIQMLSRTDAPATRRLTLLQEEIRLGATGTTPESAFNATIALDSIWEVTRDPGAVESALRQAFDANPDADFRAMLLGRVHGMNETLAQRLEREFGR